MNIKQLITVNIDETPTIDLKIWNDGWQTEKVLTEIAIGKNGATTDKREGDFKTPLGLFKLGSAFGTSSIKTDYPYLKVTNDSYWVDDSMSPNYNKWVELNKENIKINRKEISWEFYVISELQDLSSLS